MECQNQCKQDDLGLKMKFEVKEWSTRLKNSILAICIVYAGENVDASMISPDQFFFELADQLIDNNYGRILLRHRDLYSAFEEREVE